MISKHKNSRTNVALAVSFLILGIGDPSHAQDRDPATVYTEQIGALATFFTAQCGVTPKIEERRNNASNGICMAVSSESRVASERCVPANLFVFNFCSTAIIEAKPKATLSASELNLLLDRADVLPSLVGKSIRYYLDSKKTDSGDLLTATPSVLVEYRRALGGPTCHELRTTMTDVVISSNSGIASTGGQTAWRRICADANSK
jgi:hypothetical protein